MVTQILLLGWEGKNANHFCVSETFEVPVQCHLWGFSDKKFFEILIIISNSSRIISFLKVCHWTSSQKTPRICSLFLLDVGIPDTRFWGMKIALCVFRERVLDSGHKCNCRTTVSFCGNHWGNAKVLLILTANFHFPLVSKWCSGFQNWDKLS